MEKLLENRTKWEANRASFYAWLDQTPEEALEPELEIVDTHHHMWDMRSLGGFNLFGIFRQQYYMTDELVDDIVGGGHNITHSVFLTSHAFVSAVPPQPSVWSVGWMPLGHHALRCRMRRRR